MMSTEVSRVAQPLANEKLRRRIIKLVKIASESKCLIVGVKDVVKKIQNHKGLCVIAGDTYPFSIMGHIAPECEDKDIPYIYVPSKKDLGNAAGCKRPASCVFVLVKPKKGKLEDDVEKKLQRAYNKVVPEIVEVLSSIFQEKAWEKFKRRSPSLVNGGSRKVAT